jgi:hypothetical protein
MRCKHLHCDNSYMDNGIRALPDLVTGIKYALALHYQPAQLNGSTWA